MSAIKAAIAGKIMTLLGYDGANFQNVKVDADGKVYVKVEDDTDLAVRLYGDVALDGWHSVMVAPDGQLVVVLAGDMENHVIASGYNGVTFTPLRVDNSGHLQIDVLTSALPAGAATWAYQVQTMGFIGTPATPEAGTVNKRLETLNEHIKDQLISFKGVYAERVSDLNAGVGINSLTGSVVPVGEVWVVAGCVAFNNISACTTISVNYVHDGNTIDLNIAANPPAVTPAQYQGQIYLDAGDYLKAWFVGCTAGDDLYFSVFGHKMSV